MTRYWSELELNRATPPQASDSRGRAFLCTLDDHFAKNPISGFAIKDPETCPAEALPALIAEYSMEEFIAPDLPEDRVRQILKNRWLLKKYKGYDQGVKLGLSLLGMDAEIIHWHQRVPKAPPNTQTVRFSPTAPVFAEEPSLFGPKSLAAAKQMINATKRLSQGTVFEISARVKANAYAGVTSVHHLHARNIGGLPRPPVASVRGFGGVVPFGVITVPPVRCERLVS